MKTKLFLLYESIKPTIFKQKANEKFNIKPSCENKRNLFKTQINFLNEKILKLSLFQPHVIKKSKIKRRGGRRVGEGTVNKLEREERVAAACERK